MSISWCCCQSLLNYLPYVLSCPTCLVSYVPLCLTCLVPYVPRALVPHVSRVLRSLVSHVPRALRASCLVPFVLLCPTCLVSYVLSFPMCSRISRASCPTCSCALRVSCPTCSRTSRSSCFTCLLPYVPRAKRALMSHVCYMLLYLTCLVPCVFSGCLELYMLFYFSSLTCFRSFEPSMLLCISCLVVFIPYVSCAFVALDT